MKKLLTVLMMAAAVVTLTAEDALLKSWDLTSSSEYMLWNTKSQCSKTVADGAIKITVTSITAPASPANIQFWTAYQAGFKANVKYRVEATIVSTSNLQGELNVIQNGGKYARATKDAVKYFSIKADQPTNVSIEFTPAQDISGTYRTPCFFLGNAPEGTVITISNLKLYEVK